MKLARMMVALLCTSGCHIIAGFDDLELREDAQPIWSRSYGDDALQVAEDLTARGGNVFVVGEMEGSLAFGDDLLENADGTDVFVLALDDAGNPRWSTQIQNDFDGRVRAVAANDESVFVAGAFRGNLLLDDVTLTVDDPDFESFFLARLDPARGDVQFAQSFGSLGLISTKLDLAVDSNGATIVAGGFEGTLDFGCTSAFVSSDDTALEVFVVKLVDDACAWGKAWGGGVLLSAESVGVDIDNSVIVAGEFQGDMPIDGEHTLRSRGGIDFFVVKLDKDGNHVWSRSFGDANGLQTSMRVAVHTLGTVAIAGYFQGSVDFGGGPLDSGSGHDLFVAKLDRNGSFLWSKAFATEGDECSLTNCNLDRIGLAVDGQGDLVLAGHFEGAIDFGGTDLTSNGETDMFVAKLASEDGSLLWSGNVGDDNAQCPRMECIVSAVTDGGDNVLLTGFFDGTVDYGLGPHASAGEHDAFVVKLGP